MISLTLNQCLKAIRLPLIVTSLAAATCVASAKPSKVSKIAHTTAASQEVAVIQTNMGSIVISFMPNRAPGHVANFKKLARKGFFNGIKFHRVIPGFMIQGGDPNTKTSNRSSYGMGGPGYTIKDEFSSEPHVRGIVSMANTGQPNSGGSQFFIVVKDSMFLNGKYSVFGKVIKGMEVADKIVALPRDSADDPLPGHEAVIKKVTITKWPIKK